MGSNADSSEGAGPAYRIDPGADIGHVHLKVADLERALGFWRDVLGFELQQRLGDEAAFLSAGGYHHHIGLNTWLSRNGEPPDPRATGLFHVTIRYPSRGALATAVARVMEAGIALDGASDHSASDAPTRRSPRDQRCRWPAPCSSSAIAPPSCSRRFESA